MRRALLALWLAFGCAEDHEPSPHGGTAGASGQPVAQAGQAADPPLRAVIADWLTQYDRQVRGLCACQVGWGDFATVDDCFAMVGSDESWADCVANAAVGIDTSGLQSLADCSIAQLRERADCFDAMPTCTKENVGNCAAALLPIVAACPQTILLTPR